VKIKTLSVDEVLKVAEVIHQILPTEEFEKICSHYNLIKLQDRREEVYIIKKEEQWLLDELTKMKRIPQCKLVLVKIKLGFFIGNQFRLGIESLPFLASICNHEVTLSSKQAERFIYGKDVTLLLNDAKKGKNKIRNNSLVVIFNENNLALGYAKTSKNQEVVHLQNIIDIGLYVRSEKTAF
jgi:ribosome biogenesis protein Nip4